MSASKFKTEATTIAILPTNNRRFRTQYNYQQTEGESNTLPSETVPNQAQTIKQILAKYVQGQPLNMGNDLAYTGDNMFPDIKSLDLTEIDSYKQYLRTRIAGLEEELREANTKSTVNATSVKPNVNEERGTSEE